MIRKMTLADIEQVSGNEAVCFSRPWSLNAFRDVLTREHSVYLVAEQDGKVVGHCGVTNIVGEGEITNVAVIPEYRNQGLGQQLLETLISEGQKIGIKDFTLEVRAGNTSAIHLYEKAGFISEGVRPGFYEAPKEDALIMWKRQAE